MELENTRFLIISRVSTSRKFQLFICALVKKIAPPEDRLSVGNRYHKDPVIKL